ncbi:hypothetical protein [Merismopedia glauca]|uniref:PsbP C-terminal domain-containing protein n=2 Tax=Merismopedia TaxID=53402 RepID=A0A2T1C5E8_9CYAN|nr:hypothetical protein [Merismopedia glauca]PSB03343.1 hypothetical protein C7B64_08790 [Merismopedia glauca CCAP 1448/3]
MTKKLLPSLTLVGLTLGGCIPVWELAKDSSPSPTTSTSVTPTASSTPYTEPSASTAPSSNNVFVSPNGQIQVNLPPGWSKAQGLNDKAELEVSNAPREMYLIVLSESKADFQKAGQDINLPKHSDLTRGILLKSITNAQTIGPKSITVNGNPALQYEILGIINNINIGYLHTTVETANNYHQIIAYTSQSDFSKNRSEMEEVINSFQEVK